MRIEHLKAATAWLGDRVDRARDSWQERFSCHSNECRNSGRIWKKISNHAESIRLQGMQFCFPECFERELRRGLEKLMVARPEKVRAGTHRVPLGLLMLSRGDLESAGLRAALAAQRRSGQGRIGEWIEKMGLASEQQVTAALAAQWSCPLLAELPQPLPHCPVPFPLLNYCRMVPAHYSESARVMHVAFSEGVEYSALLAIEQALQCHTEPCFVTSRVLDAMLGQMEERSPRAAHSFSNAATAGQMTRIASTYASTMNADDVRLAKCAGFVWIRLEGRHDAANLLFWIQADEPMSRCLAAKRSQEVSPVSSSVGYAGSNIPFSR